VALAEGEQDERKKKLMLNDYAARASALPPRLRAELDERITSSYVPAALRRAGPSAPEANAASVDVLIVSPKPVERDAVLLAFDLTSADAQRGEDHRDYYRTELPPQGDRKRSLSTVVTLLGAAGNVDAAARLAEIRRSYEADAYFLCGMAAGRAEVTELGDVFAPQLVTYYAYGNSRADGFHPRPRPAPIAQAMELDLVDFDPGKVSAYERLTEALARVAGDMRPEDPPESFRPAFKSASVSLATTDEVLENGEVDLLAGLADRFDDDLRLADMEAHGFQRAAGPRWAIFRGIADHATLPRRKDWQTYATVAAAVMLRSFLEHRYMPPEEREL
jgi:nucleoside phosphorylase